MVSVYFTDGKNLYSREEEKIMGEKLIKNVEHRKAFCLKDLVDYEAGKVASMTLAQQPGVGMTVFAFDAGEGISAHAAGYTYLAGGKQRYEKPCGLKLPHGFFDQILICI